MKTTPTLSIEAGKTYLNKRGDECIIYAVHEQSERPIHGAYKLPNQTVWYPLSWRSDGKYYLEGSKLDIVKEKSKTMWVRVWYNNNINNCYGVCRDSKEAIDDWEARHSGEDSRFISDYFEVEVTE